MDYFIEDAKSIQATVNNNKQIISLFSKVQYSNKKEKDILRDKIYKILKPKYKILQLRGILQWHFVLPDNRSFLRMHKPSKYGDNLSDTRYSYTYVNKIKKPISGFEKGKVAHAFRYVFPLYNNQNKYIGAMEISLATYTLQSKLLNTSKTHSHFLVNKNVFSAKKWEEDNLVEKYIQSIEHKNYMFAVSDSFSKENLEKNKKELILPLKKEINHNISLEKPFSLYLKNKEDAKIITFLPIKNIKNDNISAYIVTYSKNGNIYNIYNDYYKTNIMVFLGLLIIFYFIYKNLNYKNDLEREVKEKTNELNSLNNTLEQKVIYEIEKNKTIQKKLFQSEKLASMGDMIGNIAHQWRQPLSVISTASSGMLLQKEYDTLTDDQFIDFCNIINKNTQYLSKTIDDFRNFIKGDRTKIKFDLNSNINSFLNLVDTSRKTHNINIILDLKEDIKIDGYENELIQCFINIFNNSKDILNENNIDNKFIFISAIREKNKVSIKIKDNGGGIPDEVLPRIFEPYFTTKHQSQGTGLGLNMTYKLIVDGMNGTIEAINEEYEYNNKCYRGAQFIIILPVI